MELPGKGAVKKTPKNMVSSKKIQNKIGYRRHESSDPGVQHNIPAGLYSTTQPIYLLGI